MQTQVALTLTGRNNNTIRIFVVINKDTVHCIQFVNNNTENQFVNERIFEKIVSSAIIEYCHLTRKQNSFSQNGRGCCYNRVAIYINIIKLICFCNHLNYRIKAVTSTRIWQEAPYGQETRVIQTSIMRAECQFNGAHAIEYCATLTSTPLNHYSISINLCRMKEFTRYANVRVPLHKLRSPI